MHDTWEEAPYLGQFFAGQLSVGLGPAHFAWVPFHLEVLVTLGAAEPKHLLRTPHLLSSALEVSSVST